MVFRILGQHLLLDSFRISVLYCVREIVDVGACCPMSSRPAAFPCPGWIAPPDLWQTFRVRSGVQASFQGVVLADKGALGCRPNPPREEISIRECTRLRCACSHLHRIRQSPVCTIKRQNWLSQGLRNHQPPQSLPSFSCSIENIYGPSVPMSVTTFCVETT